MVAGPNETPILEYQFPPSNDLQCIQIAVNASTDSVSDWRKALLFLSSQSSTGRLVLAWREESTGLVRKTLASWISECRPALRGQYKDAVYFCSKRQRYQRLETLFRQLREVAAAASIDGALQPAAGPSARQDWTGRV